MKHSLANQRPGADARWGAVLFAFEDTRLRMAHPYRSAQTTWISAAG
jgi:hypothetical protein